MLKAWHCANHWNSYQWYFKAQDTPWMTLHKFNNQYSIGASDLLLAPYILDLYCMYSYLSCSYIARLPSCHLLCVWAEQPFRGRQARSAGGSQQVMKFTQLFLQVTNMQRPGNEVSQVTLLRQLCSIPISSPSYQVQLLESKAYHKLGNITKSRYVL